jgi:hypothetical protein
VERVFVEIEASWRDSRHREKLFIKKKSSWREALRGERLQGETLYMERTAKERGFVERLSPGRTWPASSCRLVHILLERHQQGYSGAMGLHP